jgi:hypothetical protein
MKIAKAMALIVMAAPLAALAQVSYSQARIAGERPVIREALRVCADRTDKLWDRKALLDQDKRDIDGEGRAIAQATASLAAELRRLDASNLPAVAAYNARSEALNTRVDWHNRRVAEMNGAAALLNADSADMTSYCERIQLTRR